MLDRLRLALALFCVGQAACAENPPFLWEAQGAEGATVYLLGTYHFDGTARAALAPSVWTAFEQSTVFFGEADTRDADPTALWEQARLPAVEALNRQLSPGAWQQLVRALDPAPPGRIATVRPWLVNSMLLSTLQPTAEAMDVALLREAGRAGKGLEFFETTEQQVALLNRIPLAEGIAQLERDMNDFGRLQRDLDALLAAYRRGDAQGFVALDGYDRTSATFDILIRQRNRAWLPRIEASLGGSQRAFFAVGVSHLIGSDSLIELLAAEGYQVRRVSSRRNL